MSVCLFVCLLLFSTKTKRTNNSKMAAEEAIQLASDKCSAVCFLAALVYGSNVQRREAWQPSTTAFKITALQLKVLLQLIPQGGNCPMNLTVWSEASQLTVKRALQLPRLSASAIDTMTYQPIVKPLPTDLPPLVIKHGATVGGVKKELLCNVFIARFEHQSQLALVINPVAVINSNPQLLLDSIPKMTSNIDRCLSAFFDSATTPERLFFHRAMRQYYRHQVLEGLEAHRRANRRKFERHHTACAALLSSLSLGLLK
jgi:hypothetical protein